MYFENRQSSFPPGFWCAGFPGQDQEGKGQCALPLVTVDPFTGWNAVRSQHNSDVALPRIPADLPVLAFDVDAEAGEYTNGRISDADLSGFAAPAVLLEQVLLQRVLLNQTRLSGAKLFDVRCESSDLSGGVWQKSRWQRVHLKGCKLTGMQLASFNGADVLFQDCTMEGTIFSSGKLRSVRFEKCRMHRAVFDRMDISDATFVRCDLTGADLTGSTLARVDLRGSDIPDIRLDVRQFSGLTIDPEQAVQIVAQLGCTVKGRGRAEGADHSIGSPCCIY